jgi:hypothetical protein
MNTPARIINAATMGVTPEDIVAANELGTRIPGWSNLHHVAFFKAALRELFGTYKAPSILVCGVYHGLDLAIIADLAARYHSGRQFRLVGVDLFSSQPCADWPQEKRGMTWEQAFGCAPPNMIAAATNCPRAEIRQCDSVTYLANNGHDFDFIYLDTSHDEQTVRRELTSALINPRDYSLIAGDDYGGEGGFEGGVQRAVDSMLPNHLAVFNRIWISQT